jgi:hypothetical protein
MCRVVKIPARSVKQFTERGGELRYQIAMKYSVVVATHHKTGTVWMDGVFKAIARELDVEYVDFRPQHGRLTEALRKPFILLNYDSNFREYAYILNRDDVRVLHVVRDPRDVLISAMHYHKRSSESWLHEPVPGYDNVTYQRRLRALPTKFDQYVFEMEHSTAGTLGDLLKWQYGRANCFEARYEDLRQDVQLSCWKRISAFLGFDEREQQIASRCFWQNSLFGGLSRIGNKHVRSGDIAQWKCEFTRDLGYAFLTRFPDALQSLGYEVDNGWITNLAVSGTTGLLAKLKRFGAAQRKSPRIEPRPSLTG